MRKTKRWNRYRHITLCWVQKVITSPSPTTLGFSVCSSRQICCLTSTSLCTCPTPRSSLARCHWPHQIPITVNVNVYKCLHVTAPQSWSQQFRTMTSSLCRSWTATYPEVQAVNCRRTFVRLRCSIHMELSTRLAQSHCFASIFFSETVIIFFPLAQH